MGTLDILGNVAPFKMASVPTFLLAVLSICCLEHFVTSFTPCSNPLPFKNTLLVVERSHNDQVWKKYTRTGIRVRSTSSESNVNRNRIEPCISIEYCTGCRWLFRSAWLAQELLTTFEEELAAVQLIPSKPPSQGGTFVSSIRCKYGY